MALYHAALGSIFPLELTDALYGIPSDWGMFRRMLAAGVRMGMVERIVVDGYPSTLWTPRGDGPGPPEWEHVPEGWARARDPAQACSRGWDVEAVAEAYARRWPAFLAALAGSGPLGVGHEVPAGDGDRARLAGRPERPPVLRGVALEHFRRPGPHLGARLGWAPATTTRWAGRCSPSSSSTTTCASWARSSARAGV